MSVPLRVLYCHCTYANVVPKATKAEVLRQLTESDVPFEAVADLCELTSKKDPCLKELTTTGGILKIAACYPRAVKWMFSGAGHALPAEGVEILNMRTDTPEQVLAAILPSPAEAQS
ncbi:MAG: hypothetical protein ACRC8S_16130 [Fimbriiglobus sp.]